MLESLVVKNKIFGLYMKYIANKKCQLHHLHMVKYFIQLNMIKIADIYVSITIPNINN